MATDQSQSKQPGSRFVKQQSDWIKIIEQWKASGMSQSDYCDANQINYHQFIYQHGKISGRIKTKSKLLPVKVSQFEHAAPEKNHFMLHYPNGLKLYIPVNTHPTVIKAFLACMEKPSC
jgi:hypothetical protein